MLSSRSSYYPDPMNHHLNTNAGLEFYRRSDSGNRMPLGHHSSLVQDHFEIGASHGHMSRRTSPSSTDNDGRHGTGPPRKRVPVACERCRRRKIKCSGDESGAGCSNCRNAGLSGCHFQRVATIPDATTYLAYQQAQRTRAHANHWHQVHHGHIQRYSPYSASPSSHHYTRQHSSAYGSYASSSPTTYGSHSTSGYGADYTTHYSTGVSQGVSWTRTGSDSAYHGYDNDASAPTSADNFASQVQPASFLLPNTDPMGSTTNTGYHAMMIPYGRSNSHVWADQSVLNGTYGSEANTEHAASVYEGPLHVSAVASQKADAPNIPYPLITNTSSLNNIANNTSDRTLPTPGGRSYPHSQQSSAFDNLPLSAVSHRSSIGWSTDSGSGASHVSSQTSLTDSTPGGHKHGNDRSIQRRGGHDSQDLDYNYVGYNNSPQVALPLGNLMPEAVSMSYNTMNNPRHNSGAVTAADASVSSSLTQTLPSHQRRCRTISQESTPMQQSNTTSTVPGITPTDTSTGSALSTSSVVSKSSNCGNMSELGVTASDPADPGNLYNNVNRDVDNSRISYPNNTRPASGAVFGSSYPLISSRNTSDSRVQEGSRQPSPSSRVVGSYRGDLNIDGYTTTSHQASTSSFVRAGLVAPSSQSQTRAAATSGEGSARLASVSSSLSGRTSARGSDGSASSMLSNFGSGVDGLGLGVGYVPSGTPYSRDDRAISAASVGLSHGRGDADDYNTNIPTYPGKELGSGGDDPLRHCAGTASTMGSDTASMIEYERQGDCY